ncbi:MAG TPA: DUF4974 domain-containing protein, partial [Mucilaginibacter sp.]|nr:DUF4974 domain-containing protein [Mucilaginibacter sp.]
YEDESEYRTTLVTGAITVNKHDITPGKEAIISGENIAIRKANIEQTIAWKQNDFYFNGEHIDVIMRQLARWYNIEVKYEGKMTSEVFFARINRKKNISSVLRLLEKTQKIHFKIEGRRVTVLSKK